MSKKKKNNDLFNLLAVCGGLLGVVALVLYLFTPVLGVVVTLGDPYINTGAQIIFGTELKTVVVIANYNFSFLGLLLLLVIVVGVAGSLYGFAKKHNLAKLCAGALLIVSAVLVFITPSLVVFEPLLTIAKSTFSLQFGAYISGILLVFAGGLNVVSSVLK
ncbi:MAG: hypothetical protein LBV58_03105 [Acholeplasmatales bacterium]|jgi:low temperature requirement protein LtrA|nr:hypothetical protein [Acholeplasmatales bacterium]